MDLPPYVQAFIDNHLPCARSVELFFRVPVSVTLAFAGIESDWGRSLLAKKGIIFGQQMQEEDATINNSVKISLAINRKETTVYFRKNTVREAFLAFAEDLQMNALFKDAQRNIENPEKFIELISIGSQTGPEKEKTQMALSALKTFKLQEFDSWLHVGSLARELER